MKCRASLFVLVFLGILPRAFGSFDGYVTLSADNFGGLTSTTNVVYTFDIITCTNCTYQLIGDHKILESNGGGVVRQNQWGVYGTQYRNTLNAAGAPGSCYFATSNASMTGQPPDAWAPSVPLGSGGPWQSSSACIAAPPPPPPAPDPGPGGCIDNCGGGTDGTFNSSSAGNDPLVISLSGPYKLSGIDDPVSFDMNAVGHPQQIGWTAPEADVAFLALDLNGNGRIDDGTELFGNATALRGGGRASNGFTALAQYDLNGDGVIDASDPIWTDLLLWINANHNGRCDPGELQHITLSSITAIDIDHHWSGRRDQYGNHFGFEGRLHEGKAVRSFYDVFFVMAH